MFGKKQQETNIFKRLAYIYEDIEAFSTRVNVGRVFHIKFSHGAVIKGYDFKFASGLGIIDLSICNTINQYTLTYKKGEEVLFQLTCTPTETALIPFMYKDSKMQANAINLAIYELEQCLEEIRLDHVLLEDYHEEQVKLLEEA